MRTGHVNISYVIRDKNGYGQNCERLAKVKILSINSLKQTADVIEIPDGPKPREIGDIMTFELSSIAR